ncbi:MAG: Hpt domain-containing protein [Oligoflexales bacterium]
MSNTQDEKSRFEHLDGSTVDYLRELRQTDPDIIDDLVGLFLHNAEQAINNIGDCIRNRSWVDAKHYIHKLKGSSLALGAQDIAKICESLEQVLAREAAASSVEANRLVDELKETASITFAEIERLKSIDAA